MRKNQIFTAMAVFCLFAFFACGFAQAGGGVVNPPSMLEKMKDTVVELRMFLMSPDYMVKEIDTRNLRRGGWPDWDEDALMWFSIPVANREYDAVIRVPAGEYKICFLALGGKWYQPIFFSVSDEIVSVREGETVAPEIQMEPLGLFITVRADGVVPEEIGSAKISFVLGGQPGTDDVGFRRDWETGETVSEIFLPYGATDVVLLANTDKQLMAPVDWKNVVDGKIVVHLEPQLAGGVLAPVIVWPEEPEE